MKLKSGSIKPLLKLSDLMSAFNYESFHHLAQGDTSSEVVDLDTLWPTLSVQNQYRLLERWLFLLKRIFKFSSFESCSNYLKFYREADSKTWVLIESENPKNDAEQQALQCIRASKGLYGSKAFNLRVPFLYYFDLFLNARSKRYDQSMFFGEAPLNQEDRLAVKYPTVECVQLDWGDHGEDASVLGVSRAFTAGLALAAVVGVCAVWGGLLFSNTLIIIQCCLVLMLPLTWIVSEMYFVHQENKDVLQPIKAVGLRLVLGSALLIGIGATALFVVPSNLIISVFYVAIIFSLAPIMLSMFCYERRWGYMEISPAVDFGWADSQNIDQSSNALDFSALKHAKARADLLSSGPAQPPAAVTRRLRPQTPPRPHGGCLPRVDTPPPLTKRP
jgi:hypothetical protein